LLNSQGSTRHCADSTESDIGQNLVKAAELGYQAIEVHMRETTQLDIPMIRKTMEKLESGSVTLSRVD